MVELNMKKWTIFSWGYREWGSSAAQFVKTADGVEAASAV